MAMAMAMAPLFITLIFFLSLPILPTHQKTSPIPTISAAPAVLPDPDTDLSPDITPLLPSPGRAAASPDGSSMPTIPSTRTPNPDMLDPVGPDSAFAPSGSVQESSAVEISIKGFEFGLFSCCFLSWLVMFMV